MKLSIGLTGGIGSGKSTVAERFGRLGASIVDADEISRALTSAAGAAMPELRQEFGMGLVAPDGALDRRAMRELAFADPGARARLEAILHPRVRAESDRMKAAAPGPYVMMVVPLLFETGGQARVDRTLVVDAPEDAQVDRVERRSALAPGEVRQVMAAQWPRWRRLQMADDVVFNGATPSALDAQCERLHARYAAMARARA